MNNKDSINYLVDSYSLENIKFSKPKKYKNEEYYISKVKYSKLSSNNELITDNNLLLQFSKMNISSGYSESSNKVELEFINNKYNKYSKYSNKVYNFLSKLDNHIIDTIHNNSEEWFEKKIPLENVKLMYNSFLKAPKSSENNPSMVFSINNNGTTFYDHKNNDLSFSDFKTSLQTESIVHLKYLMFSKDNCFTIWELISSKICKQKMNKVPKYGFIDDPLDFNTQEVESDNEDIIIKSFF